MLTCLSSVRINFFSVFNMDYDKKIVGGNIRAARKRKDLTIKELAVMVGEGIHFNTLGLWERGINQIPWPMLEKVAEVLDTTVEKLTEGAEVIENFGAAFLDAKRSREAGPLLQPSEQMVLLLKSIDQKMDRLVALLESFEQRQK